MAKVPATAAEVPATGEGVLPSLMVHGAQGGSVRQPRAPPAPTPVADRGVTSRSSVARGRQAFKQGTYVKASICKLKLQSEGRDWVLARTDCV